MSTSNVSGASEDKQTIHCKWRLCSTKTGFKSIEEVLDHVLLEHIPKVVKDEDGVDEVVCEWDICETSINKGDLDKKTAWMQNHFKTRHAKKAKTFKCLIEGCHEMRATSQEIETHVRLSHFTKKKSESTPSSSKESSATPQPEETKVETPILQPFWKLVDGRPVYQKPPKVTKKTIIHFSDGPRVVLPPGVWARQDPDPVENVNKGWTPSSYHPLYNPNGKRYDQKKRMNSPEGEIRRSSPKKVEREKPKVVKVLKKRESLHSITDRLVKNYGKTREEIRLEKEEPEWKGSFWWNVMEAEKHTKAAEAAKKLDEEAEKPVKRQNSEPPRLSEEPVVSPKRSRAARKMPILTAHFEDSVDSETESLSSGKEETPRKKRIARRSVQFEKPKDMEVEEVQEHTPTKPKNPVGRPRKHQKKPEEALKRSDRACRPRFSLYDVDEDFEKNFELEIQKRPTTEKEERPVTPLSPKSPRNLKDSKPEVQESLKTPKRRSEKFELKSPRSLKSPKTPKSPEPERRPKRACRPLGSMEEVPYMLEIGVEFSMED